MNFPSVIEPLAKNPTLLWSEDHVVVVPHFSIETGAANFHPRGTFGVEEKGCAPAIAEFAVRVDGGMIGWDERQPKTIATGERGSDVGVVADGISGLQEIRTERIE